MDGAEPLPASHYLVTSSPPYPDPVFLQSLLSHQDYFSKATGIATQVIKGVFLSYTGLFAIITTKIMKASLTFPVTSTVVCQKFK